MAEFVILPALLRFIVRVAPSHEKARAQEIICFADTYDIKPDGSLLFWGRLRMGKEGASKIVNVPTLSYAPGKWEGVTLSWGDEMPAFVRAVAGNNEESHPGKGSVSSDLSNSVAPLHAQANNTSLSPSSSSPTYPSNNNVQGGQSGNYYRPSSTIPGFDSKQREEWEKERAAAVGKALNAWFQKNDRFPGTTQFLKQIPELLKGEPFPKMVEEDFEWAVVSLLKKKMYPVIKFQSKEIYRFIDLNLPGIIKRHGAGKLSPLLNMLRDLEETKNVGPIDLVVWMINNHQLK